jgi:hypothetical protein
MPSRLRSSSSRVARIAIGVTVALGLIAAVLAACVYLVSAADEALEDWLRPVAELLFVVSGVCLVGLLLVLAFAGHESARRFRGARTATLVLEWLGGATLLALVSFSTLVGGGIAVVVFVVGGTAAACAVLYGVGELFAYLFAISRRWGLVIACGLLVITSGAGGLIHDIRLEVMPPQAPPKEHE